MQLGCSLPVGDIGTGPTVLRDYAQAAEGLGFNHLMAPDHVLGANPAADHGAFQWGFCTPGMVLSVKALLERHPDPDEPLIRQWLNANICRCTGYRMIVKAVQAAARAVQR